MSFVGHGPIPEITLKTDEGHDSFLDSCQVISHIALVWKNATLPSVEILFCEVVACIVMAICFSFYIILKAQQLGVSFVGHGPILEITLKTDEGHDSFSDP